ncbi:immune inhibitor A [bacterium]|nr:immune inhibitor A [bacterium]
MRIATTALVLLLVLGALSPLTAGEHKTRVEIPGFFSRGLLDCTGAESYTCSETIYGTNVGGAMDVVDYGCDCWEEDGPEVVYEIVIGGTDPVHLMAALVDADVDIDLYLLASCDEGDCLACGDYVLQSGAIDPGIYYLVADGYNLFDEGSFTIELTCTPVEESCCPSLSDCVVFDFGAGHNGVSMEICESGSPTWEWGPASGIPTESCDGGAIGTVLATTLGGNYPDEAGDAAVIGPMTVTETCSCLELCHWYEIEELYDGANVKISTDGGLTWAIVAPQEGYDGWTGQDPYCVESEPVFNEEHIPAPTFFRHCFNLGAYVGEEILVGLFFGSDSSYTMRGWYIDKIILGTGDVPVESSSWGVIKALYR